MIVYILRRVLYAIPILIGVNICTFILFFLLNTPDDMARMHLGQKRISAENVEKWKQQYGYDKPMFFNLEQAGFDKISETIFFQKSVRLLVFDFGRSDRGRDISYDISQRMWPSLAIAIPSFFIGLILYISFAMFLCLFRGSYFDIAGVFLCVVLMSISSLFYIIVGQMLVAELLNLVPISGYDTGLSALKFILLPVFISVVAGIGSSTRWYRTIFLEEMNKDYVRTARSKGLSEWRILYYHVLKNSLIPILTGVIVVLPLLFMGSLIIESFFAIPGLGSYTIDAITSQDFAIVRAMVFLGSVLYIIGLLLTDISYAVVDPRIRIQ